MCGSREIGGTYAVREMMFGLRETFTYLQCSNCEGLYITDTPEDFSAYYPPDYYSFSHGRRRNRGRLKRRIKRLVNSYAVFGEGWVGRLLYGVFPEPNMRCLSRNPVNRSTRLLEIGSGDGAYLQDLAEIGFTTIAGIDPYIEEDISVGKEVRVFKRTIEDVSGKWDIIIFNHSFEHCEDPAAQLMQVSRLLDPHGVCIIRVPTVSSFAWEQYRTDWVQIDAPRHCFIPSILSAQLLAEGAHLRLADVEYDSTAFQFWGSEQYRNDIDLYSASSYLVSPRRSMFRSVDILSFSKRARQLNLEHRGDQMILYLKKP